jgi:hemoglobin
MTRLDSSIQEYSMASIYEQIGGEAAIQAAVEIFYRKVLSDDRIAHFFDDVDMDQQIAKQKSFLTMVTGGPNQYTGKNMRDAHQRLVDRGLDDSHVDAVIQHLGATLAELGVPESIIQQIASAAEGLREDVLCR